MAAPAVRRADFLMALAYATDLATGHSRDFALRSCVLAMRFAEVAGLDQDTRRSIYHQALLRYIGCNADTHLLAAAWGDEITLRRELHHIDMGNRAEFVELFVRAMKRKFAGASPEELAEAVERGLAEGPQVNIPILSGHCEVAQRIAERIGLPEEIRENLGQIYERWDGKGLPRGLSGNAVKFPVRVVTLAQDAIALNDHHGFATMKEMIAKRAGGGYEPELVDLFLTHAEQLLAGLDGPVDRETILALEPVPHAMLDEEACEEAYLAIADMIDMRMPFTFGHSRAVASLADAAAKQHGSSRVRHSRRPPGGLHARHRRTGGSGLDLDARRRADRTRDRCGAPSSLSWRARARVAWAATARRLRRWCSAITSGSTAAAITATRKAPDLSPAARILAAAEAFQTAREARPHRPALSDAAAAAKLRAAVREGKLCPDAVEAVLACAGQPARRATAERLAGLTPREIEVLRLIAAGRYRKGSRPQARYRAEDRRQPHPEPLFQDRRHHPGRRCPLRPRARAGSAGMSAA